MKKTPAELRAQKLELDSLLAEVHFSFGTLMTDVSRILYDETLARLRQRGFFKQLAAAARALSSTTECYYVANRITAARAAQSSIDNCKRELADVRSNRDIDK